MSADVGDKVVYRGQQAVVKYCGPLHHSQGIWVGVEFQEAAVGRNNGSTGGKQYFECKLGHGLFVRPGNLVIIGKNDSASSTAFSQWQVFDTANEGEFLKSNNLGQSAESVIRSTSRKTLSLKGVPSPPDSYKGPKFDSAITDECINKLTHYYKTANEPLHAYYVMDIVQKATRLFAEQVQSAVHDIAVPPTGTLIVCGDTHGQLEDLLWIFFKHGPPSPERVYLMNGDIADRGEQALEVFIVLLAYKVAYPESVWINKGNHEDSLMNLRYGFHDEMKGKYSDNYQQIFQAFQKLFFTFPLSSTIENQVFVVHGGLCRKPTRLNLLASVDHRRPVPDSPKNNLHDMIFYDMLWSDPSNLSGVQPNPRGGETITFGPDITNKFLFMNKLRLLIRSHQVPDSLDEAGFPRGFAWHHHIPNDSKIKPLCKDQPGMCLTVFSASNYVGTNANMGGVVMFRGSVENFEILEHYAQDVSYLHEVERETAEATQHVRTVAMHEKECRERMMKSAAGLMESQALEELKSLIVHKKHELFDWFWAVDNDKDLHLKPELWREGCSEILSESLPWSELQEKLQVVDKSSGLIRYTSFLSRFQIRFRNKLGLHAGFRRAITDRCYEMLLIADLSMRETFAVLDRNDDGLVSLREFQEVLSSLGTGMTKPQLQALMKTIAVHGCHPGTGGKLRIEDFLSRLQLKYSATHAKVASKEQNWVPSFLCKVARDIIVQQQKKQTQSEDMVLQSNSAIAYLTEFFNSYDLDKSGYLEQAEYILALKTLPCCKTLSAEKLQLIGNYCDVVGNGRINYLEFLHAFHIEESSGTELSEDILEQVYRVMHFEFTQPMKRAFLALEGENDRVTPERFEEVINTVNNLSSPPPLSEPQIRCLIDTLSLGEDGKLDYTDYLSSFEIVDVLFDEVLAEDKPAEEFEEPATPTT